MYKYDQHITYCRFIYIYTICVYICVTYHVSNSNYDIRKPIQHVSPDWYLENSVAMPPTPPDHSKGSDIFNLCPHKQHTHGASKGTQMYDPNTTFSDIHRYTMFLKEYLEDDLRWVSNYKNQKKMYI